MKLVRGTFGVMDIIEGLGYIVAFFVVLGLLLTGHVPRDLELWVGAGLGAMLLVPHRVGHPPAAPHPEQEPTLGNLGQGSLQADSATLVWLFTQTPPRGRGPDRSQTSWFPSPSPNPRRQPATAIQCAMAGGKWADP